MKRLLNTTEIIVGDLHAKIISGDAVIIWHDGVWDGTDMEALAKLSLSEIEGFDFYDLSDGIPYYWCYEGSAELIDHIDALLFPDTQVVYLRHLKGYEIEKAPIFGEILQNTLWENDYYWIRNKLYDESGKLIALQIARG